MLKSIEELVWEYFKESNPYSTFLDRDYFIDVGY